MSGFLVVPEADADLNDFSNAVYDADGTVVGLVNGTAYVVYALSEPSDPVTPLLSSTALPLIIVIAGQSNATASSTPGKEGTRYSSLSNVFIVDNTGTLVAYEAGVNSHPDGNGTNWGTEAEFALLYRARYPDAPIIICKEAVSGNEVGTDANGDWNVDNPNGRRTELITKRQAVADWLQANGHTDWREVLCWNQGEADAGLQISATVYADEVGQLMGNLRAQTYTPTGGSNGSLFHPDMTIIFERLRPQANGTQNAPFNTGLIRYGHYLFVEAELTAGRNAALIDLDQFPEDFWRIHPAADPQDGVTWMHYRGGEAFYTFEGERFDPGFASRPTPNNVEYADLFNQVPSQFTVPDLTEQSTGQRVTSGWIAV
ncbi:MAG: sialate O-acetylesterase, partial [Pseudomonadota bacterium]